MKKGYTWHALLIGFLVISLAVFSASGAHAKKFRMTIGAGHPADAAIWTGMVRDFFAPEVKKRVEADTDNKIEWVDAYGGSVAKLGGVLEAVQDGILDVGFIVYPFEPTKLFLHNMGYYIPFGSPDVIQAGKVALKVHEEFAYLRRRVRKEIQSEIPGRGGDQQLQPRHHLPLEGS